MRIRVEGDCESAKVVAGYLTKAGYVVNSGSPDYTVTLKEDDVFVISVDGIDCELERRAVAEMESLGIGSFLLAREGGVRSDRAISVTFPAKYREAVEKGVFRALMQELGNVDDKRTKEAEKPPKKGLKRAIASLFSLSLVFLVFLLDTGLGFAEVQRVPFYTSEAIARTLGISRAALYQPVPNFPIVRFWSGSVVVNAGDSGNNALRMVCISGCGGAASFDDSTAFTFGTTAVNNISAVVDDTGTNAVAENSAGAVRMTGSRILLTNLSDSTGTDKADVNADGSLDVTCVSGCSGSAFADNAAFTFGTTAIGLSGFVVDDTATNSVTENSAGLARMSASRIPYFNLRTTGGTELASGTGTPAGTEQALIVRNIPSGTQAVSGTFWQATQPVSGTVTANQGTPAATANRWPVQITDGTDLGLVSASGSVQVTCDNCGGSTFADNSAFTFGTTPIVNIGAVVDDTATNTVTENSAGNPRMNTNRILYSMNTNSTGTEVGTAGNPFRIDPTGSTVQPVSGTFWQATQPVSISQTTTNNDVDVLTLPAIPAGTNNIGDVDVLTLPALPAGTNNIGDVDVLSLPAIPAGTNNIGDVDVLTFPDNEPINIAQKGGSAVVAGACEREAPLYAQISQTTGTQIITGTASERIYICSIQIMTATAQNVALVDGTGSVCATSPTGLLGGSTAATGWNFAANGGIVLPESRGGWTKTSTDADNVCLLQSGAGQISGSITYVSVPNI